MGRELRRAIKGFQLRSKQNQKQQRNIGGELLSARNRKGDVGK